MATVRRWRRAIDTSSARPPPSPLLPRCRSEASRRTTICGGAPAPCSRVGETIAAPSSDPHRLGDDELDAREVARDLALHQPVILSGELVIAFDPEPPRHPVTDDAVDPQ